METNVYAASVKNWHGWHRLRGYEVKNHLVKIGHTGKDVENYVRNTLKNQYGVEFVLLHALWVSPDAETLLHRVFFSQRVPIRDPSTGRESREFFDLQEEQFKAAFDLLRLIGGREIKRGLPVTAPKRNRSVSIRRPNTRTGSGWKGWQGEIHDRILELQRMTRKQRFTLQEFNDHFLEDLSSRRPDNLNVDAQIRDTFNKFVKSGILVRLDIGRYRIK